jgi:hypothetical protein
MTAKRFIFPPISDLPRSSVLQALRQSGNPPIMAAANYGIEAKLEFVSVKAEANAPVRYAAIVARSASQHRGLR